RACRQAGLDARSRRHCIELLERAATAAQRLDLGGRTASVGREVLRRGQTTTGGTMTTETKIDTGTDELLCVIRDRVAIITLNRPEARNAMSDNLTPALRNMIKACGENPDVGVLLLTGAGTAFCAGGNVKGMGANRDKTKLAMSHDERVADLQERQRLLTGALVS